MDMFAALVLSAVVSEESLRFAPVYEQEAEASCGLAAAASLLTLYCRKAVDETALALALMESEPPSEAPPSMARRVSLDDIRRLVEAQGLSVRVFRMNGEELLHAADKGFVPAFVHYDRPRGHFALLIGARRRRGGDTVFVTADPSRGTEVLSAGDFLARWSGAVLLVDPACFSPEGKALRDAAFSLALRRRDLLERSRNRDAIRTVPR
jgi:predicted double-glycine peptidase